MESLITIVNFTGVRKEIESMIDQYRINAEKWVVDQFFEIPVDPTDAAIASLRLWVKKFLTPKQQVEVFENLSQSADVCRIFLSRETVEKMESVRKLYELKTMEDTVTTLLDCIRHHPRS